MVGGVFGVEEALHEGARQQQQFVLATSPGRFLSRGNPWLAVADVDERQADGEGAFELGNLAGEDALGRHQLADVSHALGGLTAHELRSGLVGDDGFEFVAAHRAVACGGTHFGGQHRRQR